MKLTNKEVQEIVARADDEYDRLKDIVHEQYDEIKRLKEEYMILQNASDEREDELIAESTKWESKFYDEAKKVDKAIEYIEHLIDDNESVELMDISFYVKGDLLVILKGSDKE